VVLICIIYLLY